MIHCWALDSLESARCGNRDGAFHLLRYSRSSNAFLVTAHTRVTVWRLQIVSDRTLLDLRCCLNGGSSNERRDFERYATTCCIHAPRHVRVRSHNRRFDCISANTWAVIGCSQPLLSQNLHRSRRRIAARCNEPASHGSCICDACVAASALPDRVKQILGRNGAVELKASPSQFHDVTHEPYFHRP